MQISPVALPVRTFTEKAAVTLDVDTLVTLHTDGTVQAATAGSVLGVFKSRLTPGSKSVAVELFGRTVRVIQDSAIAVGADVQQKSSAATKVETAAASGVVIGTKIWPASNGAQGDVIEIVLIPGGRPSALELAVPQTVVQGNVNAEIGALGISTIAATTVSAALSAITGGESPTEGEHNSVITLLNQARVDILALRAYAVATEAEIEAVIAKAEELADDHRALATGLQTAGIVTLA